MSEVAGLFASPCSEDISDGLGQNAVVFRFSSRESGYIPVPIPGLMCRNTLSVSWDGYLYDCDFNQQLDMRLDLPGGLRPHVRDFDLEAWRRHAVRTARHCYGCTAGAGSSCGGQMV